MREPSTSMNRPSGGSAFSTCRAVRAFEATSAPIAKARSARAMTTTQAKTIISVSPLRRRASSLQFGDCAQIFHKEA
jgi:hypothetical protein